MICQLPEGFRLDADGREYRIIGFIGRGALSTAYLAECSFDGMKTKCILKEYAPKTAELERASDGSICVPEWEQREFRRGRERFIRAGMTQNEIRQLSGLSNQTPPVGRVFEAQGTAYIDVSCYNGTTLDKLRGLPLIKYMALCRTVAKTVGYYHEAGYYCLDLKPENIFILQNGPDDTVTELVEFIDFDSHRKTDDPDDGRSYSYTREWAAPELNASGGRVDRTADIYTLGEIVLYLLFGRHSKETEHRGFSVYPFEECRPEFALAAARPDVQSKLAALFRGTLRSSAANRFTDAGALTGILDGIIAELGKKDFVVPNLPPVSPTFLGRDKELGRIGESLARNRILFVTGVGGIGKSTLVRNFIDREKQNYDVVVYIVFGESIEKSFNDELQLRISTFREREDESEEERFDRKLSALRTVCSGRKVLFVVDNFSGMVTKGLNKLLDCGFYTVIVSRQLPPPNSFPVMKLGPIDDRAELFRLVSLGLGRSVSADERQCWDEIFGTTSSHTLIVELIARQIAAGCLDVHDAVKLIRERGILNFTDQKIYNSGPDGEVYDSLSGIIDALFDAGSLPDDQLTELKILSLFDARGLERDLVRDILDLPAPELLPVLAKNGWIIVDKIVRVHPVIAAAASGRSWPVSLSDTQIMRFYKDVVDVYVGLSDPGQVLKVVNSAEEYVRSRPRRCILAMYHDLLASYYDTLLEGHYCPENERDVELNGLLGLNIRKAVSLMEKSKDPCREKLLPQYYLSLAINLIRGDPKYWKELPAVLRKTEKLIDRQSGDNSENECYYCMAMTWYHTLVEADPEKMTLYSGRAADLALKVFKTDIERIDIVHIPTANCFFFLSCFDGSAQRLKYAADLCEQHPDAIPYIKKEAELMLFLLDVYNECGDLSARERVLKDLDRVNEKLIGAGQTPVDV